MLVSINILDVVLDLMENDLFSHPSGGFGNNVIIFEVDIHSPAHIDNKKKDILVLGERPTQGLDGTN